ncbi:recombinase, partial [Candidatus Collierbacteria bacterium]|nr:recombinase [Candidatus Collierbacteria bacterium]
MPKKKSKIGRVSGTNIKAIVPKTIVKRDGRVVPFETAKIEKAISLCFEDIGRKPETPAFELAARVVNIIGVKFAKPTVEQVQDTVELVLQGAGEFEAAKHYILYRAEHAKMREARPIPIEVRKAFEASDKYFASPIQKFQFFDKYSRFNYDLGRRETWMETTDRAV